MQAIMGFKSREKYRLFLLRVLYGAVLVLWFMHLIISREELKLNEEYQEILKKAPTPVRHDQPELSQHSVDLAIQMFQIEIPKDVRSVIFDPALKDRGLTIRKGWFASAEVRIGRSAFTSWGLLASTLAHELEVHCHQSFMLVDLMDRLGMQGTERAERFAYLHEINNIQRFGLGTYDARLVQETMDYYYPVSLKTVGIAEASGNWLARSFLNIQP